MINITDTLFYRRIEKDDLKERVNWINDPEINHTLTFETPVSLASSEAWFSKVVLDDTKANLMFFVSDEGYKEYTPIAFGGFINVDRKVGKGELYITLGNKNYQGKGFGKRIVEFLVHFGFTNLALQKIYLSTLEHNYKAIGLYESCGFKHEGIFHKHVMHQGKLKNLIYMAKFNK